MAGEGKPVPARAKRAPVPAKAASAQVSRANAANLSDKHARVHLSGRSGRTGLSGPRGEDIDLSDPTSWKMEGAHQAIFRDGDLLSEEHGAKLAQWAPAM